jgi:hypothetical protein
MPPSAQGQPHGGYGNIGHENHDAGDQQLARTSGCRAHDSQDDGNEDE